MSKRCYTRGNLNIPRPAGLILLGIDESEGTLMMWGYGFGWGWLMMSFGTVLWIALLVVLVWALMRWLNSKTSTSTPMMTHMPPSGPSAEEILRQRYARGEIDTATFERMRERLGASDRRSYQPGNQPVTSDR